MILQPIEEDDDKKERIAAKVDEIERMFQKYSQDRLKKDNDKFKIAYDKLHKENQELKKEMIGLQRELEWEKMIVGDLLSSIADNEHNFIYRDSNRNIMDSSEE